MSGLFSASVPLSVSCTGVICGVVTVSGVATGASLVALTVIETVANADASVPWVTRNVKLSGPL